jgi:hypothetical protein
MDKTRFSAFAAFHRHLKHRNADGPIITGSVIQPKKPQRFFPNHRQHRTEQ